MKYIIRFKWYDGSVGEMVKTFDIREEAENAVAKLNELNAITRNTIHHWVEEVADDEPKNQARA